MARHWKEPLDTARHVDHFRDGDARPRATGDGDDFAYFVRVAGFTFEFASIDQIRQCVAFFAKRIHPSSRKAVPESEKGWWQAWDERLPARIRSASPREQVVKALEGALVAFSKEP